MIVHIFVRQGEPHIGLTEERVNCKLEHDHLCLANSHFGVETKKETNTKYRERFVKVKLICQMNTGR